MPPCWIPLPDCHSITPPTYSPQPSPLILHKQPPDTPRLHPLAQLASTCSIPDTIHDRTEHALRADTFHQLRHLPRHSLSQFYREAGLEAFAGGAIGLYACDGVHVEAVPALAGGDVDDV